MKKTERRKCKVEPWKHTVRKTCRNTPNSDVDNGGAEPKDVGVGIFRPPHRLVRATVVHIGISRSFFTVQCSADPFDTDPDHAFHFDTDPEPDSTV